MGGTPVGHDPSLEAQSVLQVLLEGCWVLTRPLSVDEVVAAHDGSNVCFDRTLERRIVTARRTHTDSTASASRNGTRNDTAIAATLASPSHFVAGALVDNGIVGGAVDLLVVVDPMLAVRHDPHRLNAFDHRLHHDVAEVRVLARGVLEIASIPWEPCDAHAGTEQHVRTLTCKLGTHRNTPFHGSVFIPGRANVQGRWPLRR
mmetsp:Transcript_51602/g.142845  ORF Transcript_51602/g.142845 Transcript_51602/m.142845 type:complete len:203 (-) Transcript_51602:150-758(-)